MRHIIIIDTMDDDPGFEDELSQEFQKRAVEAVEMIASYYTVAGCFVRSEFFAPDEKYAVAVDILENRELAENAEAENQAE